MSQQAMSLRGAFQHLEGHMYKVRFNCHVISLIMDRINTIICVCAIQYRHLFNCHFIRIATDRINTRISVCAIQYR